VLAVDLNGTALAFTREANPYRLGGARLDWSALAPNWACAGDANVLRVTLA
jgi:hypothetical protein